MTKEQKLAAIDAAAGRIDRGANRGVCLAIWSPRVRSAFQELFDPRNGIGYWFEYVPTGFDMEYVERDQAKSDRLLALAFLRAMVEAGDV